MKKIFSLLTLLCVSLQCFAHGVQCAYCVLPNGFLRVYIEHWHGPQTTASLQGNGMSVTTTYGSTTVTQNVNPTGAINGTTIGNLPSGAGLINLYACPGEANGYNDWAYYDFAPAACNVPVTITLNGGLTVVLEEACGDLWPRTISATFNDNAGPILSCPSPTASVPCGTSGANVNFTVPAIDNCTPNPVVTTNYPSGYFFPVGTTMVTATSTDGNSNTSTCTFPVVVSVIDNTAPVPAGCPGNMVVQTGPASSSCNKTVSWPAPTASDNCGGAVTITTSHSPGSTFAYGATSVSYTFKDASLNTSSCGFLVTIQDNTVPTITPPANIVMNGWCQNVPVNLITLGTPVTGDNCGVLSVVNNAPLVSYPVGVTNVTWTITDIHNNVNTAIQTVTIVPATVTTNTVVSTLYPLPGQEMQTIYLGYPGSVQTETMTASPTGGTGTYTYSWAKSAVNTLTYTNLPATDNFATFTPTSADVVSANGDNVYAFRVVATDIHGCAATTVKKINVVNPYKGDSVVICHRNVSRGSTTMQLMTLVQSAVATHLAHGDYLGNCQQFTGARQAAQGVDELHPIRVYPNPTTGSFKVELHEIMDEASITVTDVQGKMVARKTLAKDAAQTAEFDLAGFSAGMYLITVKDGEMMYRTKVVLR